jgi:hypothetical protein
MSASVVKSHDDGYFQRTRELADIGRDAPGLIFGWQLSRRSPSGLILEIDVRKLLPVVIAHDETSVQIPRQTMAAGSGEGSAKRSTVNVSGYGADSAI